MHKLHNLLQVSLLLSAVLFLNCSNMGFNLVICDSTSVKMSLMVFLDETSKPFLTTINTIFLVVYMYSFHYLSAEIFLKRFLGILTLFAMSMLLLIVSGNMFTTMLGWDCLGVTSLLLILFYYSKSSLKAGTLTFLMNRVGDCSMILMVCMLLAVIEDLSVMSCPGVPYVTGLIVFTSITKSAQIPFSSWLPAAMEAPTPVSALVHSSTLVTAGIYLLFRYQELWASGSVSSTLMWLSLTTCVLASTSALVETDLKKLIALSTLSQLGFIMFSLSIGLLHQGFFHMLMHAYFKALLFMSAGYIIHSYKGNQFILSLQLLEKQGPVLITIVNISVLSMMGLPFMTGFYSKDYILDSLKNSNWALLVTSMLVFTLILTVLYSMRMLTMLMDNTSTWNSMSDDQKGMIKSMMMLTALACVGGGMFSWTMLDVALYVNNSKVALLTMLTLALSIYWKVSKMSLSKFLSNMWFLSLFNALLSKKFFFVGKMYIETTDMPGLSGYFNKLVSSLLTSSGKSVNNTLFVFSGNFELLSFLLTALLMMVA